MAAGGSDSEVLAAVVEAPTATWNPDRTLETVDFAMRGVPWSAVGRALGVILFFLLLGGPVLVVSLHGLFGTAGLVAASLLIPLLGAAALITPTFLRAMRTEVMVDEAGLRVRQRNVSRYVPFEEITHCAMYPWRTILANELIVHGAQGEAVLRVPLMGPSACTEAGRLYRLIQRRRKAVPERHTVLQAALTRRLQQPREQWLEQLLKRHAGSPYRSEITFDTHALLEFLDEPAYPVEVRAAALAVLAASPDQHHREAAALALHQGSPPLLPWAFTRGTDRLSGGDGPTH